MTETIWPAHLATAAHLPALPHGPLASICRNRAVCQPLALPACSPAVTSLTFPALQDPPRKDGLRPIILQRCSGRGCLTSLQPQLLPQHCPIHPQAQSYQCTLVCTARMQGIPGFLSLAVPAARQPSPSHFIQQDLNIPPNLQPRQQVYKLDPLRPALGQSAPGSACKHAWNHPLQEVTIKRAEHTAQRTFSKSLVQRSGQK